MPDYPLVATIFTCMSVTLCMKSHTLWMLKEIQSEYIRLLRGSADGRFIDKNVFVVNRKWLLMFVTCAVEFNICDGLFGVKTSFSCYI